MMPTMSAKRESLIIGSIFKKMAPRIGAKVLLEPTWGVAGRITFNDGTCRYFKFNAVDLNPIGSAKVASDKDYANYFMQELGYPVVEGKTFFRDDFAQTLHQKARGAAAAYSYAKRLGFPVIVKPNGGSQGTGVFLVHNKKQLVAAIKNVFKNDRIVLVQRYVSGRDYRIVVLDSKIISAYERIPLFVIGDGKHSVRELLERKQRSFEKTGRDTKLKYGDERIMHKLACQNMSTRSVPAPGVRIQLLDNANLSAGGESLDVTNVIHDEYKRIAIALTKDMGLRFCGVDIMTSGDIAKKPDTFYILEINDTPGLDHYAASGPKQRKIVENMYFEVLKSLAR